MKKFLRSFAICFSMYSRIPMPRVEWEDCSMRYVYCFFPLIGTLIGGVELGWYLLASALKLNGLLYAAVAAVTPVLITGGIHLDGFMDTCDALFSYGDREKKLEIMKDPRTGAFAVMYCGVYLLLTAGLYAQLWQTHSFFKVLMVALGFMVSRCICGLAAITMKCAKDSGLAHIFQNNADRTAAKIALVIWFVLLTAALALISLWSAVSIVAMLGLTVLLFVSVCQKQFGGVTGDLAGFVLQLSELIILLGAVIMI